MATVGVKGLRVHNNAEGQKHAVPDTVKLDELFIFWLFCSVAVYTCRTPHKVHCHSVLSSLQTNRYFENCVCNPADPDSTDCLNTQKRIFLHSCVIHEGNSSSLL